MQAIKLTEPVAASDLHTVDVPTPKLAPGYTLVQVKAFGVNESEVTSRKGESSGEFSYPRILGIEGTGVIKEADPSTTFKPGQKVAMMMTGLGRSIDGSYAEYCLVPNEALIPLETDLDWSIVGALPEMLQTSYGSLSKGLNVTSGDKILIRGGSSTVGLMSIALATGMGAKVIATTRSQNKVETMKQLGTADTIIDDGNISEQILKKYPDGVDKALELVGTTTLFDTFAAVKDSGRVCFTGALAGGWEIDHFSPFMIPSGKLFTSYAGGAKDLSGKVFNHVLKQIETKQIQIPIAKVYHGLDSVGEAQANLESGHFVGKHVVVLD